ncbi:hypothetical protein BOS5A_80185 [Bosea sp. EC-HK365B]|nr:hypothetical protein BOSE7B_20062 [Bosea sp. 7B]CAD5269474.1 hypothetical protein BOSE21B_111576 [Bosea sp. 21B]VVT62525.1 hypothetical protein BOS5A_80185 [Bosea sp. EC-HK365B]VXC62514.1 hypothetical protein BOSE127_30076 [Bosea sp. 127]
MIRTLPLRSFWNRIIVSRRKLTVLIAALSQAELGHSVARALGEGTYKLLKQIS